MADDYGIPLLGRLPLAMEIREALDRGEPTLVSSPEGEIAASYRDFARRSAALLAQQPRNLRTGLPEIKLHNQ
jgi:ATP-binding protein involved in chromosome partitioning